MSRRNHLTSVLSASYVSLLFSFFAQIYYQSSFGPTYFARQSIFISSIGLFDAIFLMQFSVLIIKDQPKNISPYIFANAIALSMESILLIGYAYLFASDVLIEVFVYSLVRIGATSFSLINNSLDVDGKYMRVNLGKGLGQLLVILIMVFLIQLNLYGQNVLILREILLVTFQFAVALWFFKKSSFSLNVPRPNDIIKLTIDAVRLQGARFAEQLFYKLFPLIVLYFTSKVYLGEFSQALFYMMIPIIAINPISERYLMVCFAKNEDLTVFLRYFCLVVVTIAIIFSAFVYFYAESVYLILDKKTWPNISEYMFVLSLVFAPITFFNLLKTYAYVKSLHKHVTIAYIIMVVFFLIGIFLESNIEMIFTATWITGLLYLLYSVKISDIFRGNM